MAGYNSKYGYDFGPAPPGVVPNAGLMMCSPGVVPNAGLMMCSQLPVVVACMGTPLVINHPSFMMPLHKTEEVPRPAEAKPSKSGSSFVYPKKTCQIYQLMCKEAPWNFTADNAGPLQIAHFDVPLFTPFADLMEYMGFKETKNYILFEVAECGSGKWSCGMKFDGSDKIKMTKPIKDFGWDDTRNGLSKIYVWVEEKK